MTDARSLIVITDLDGSLLDHDTYSFGAAIEALDLLARVDVPLIPCSSKTRAEIERIQQDLSSFHPFISENGGAVFVPDGYFPFTIRGARSLAGYQVIDFGRSYGEVVAILHRTAADLGLEVVGFSDMSVQEVADACGLSLLEARLAKLREYDEPFRLLGASPAGRNRLYRSLHAAGLRLTTGNRYDHVTGRTDKGAAVAVVRSLYRRARGEVVMVGLGDSLNDLPLLREVDIPVIVLNPAAGATSRLARKVPTARVTRGTGPHGWAEAILGILEERGMVPVPEPVAR